MLDKRTDQAASAASSPVDRIAKSLAYLLRRADIETARTVAVNTLVIAEVFYLLNTRYLSASALSREGLLGNRYVLIAIAIVIFFQILFTYLPVMQYFFATAAIDIDAWLRILSVGVVIFFAVEMEKALLRRSRKE